MTKLKEISDRPENDLATIVWDSVDFEKRLQEPRFFGLGHLFFPRSFASTPWKLYNREAPNLWTAQYKGYFLHLSSRVAGSHPDLKACEIIIQKLEAIHPTGQNEYIRPRAIYFDDKNGNFTVFGDYLVPYKQAPSLAPQQFEEVLEDGIGLDKDHQDMWFCTDWDIALKRIFPSSDHFALDHYDFYNPNNGSFRIGLCRGDTIGDLCRYGNAWRE